MWYAVASSWVAAVRRDQSGRLDVRTRKGETLHYDGVPEAEFQRLLRVAASGGSVGTYVNRVIKSNYWHAGTTP